MGSSPALGDEALQRSTADDRARAEVARMLSTYLDVVSSDYSASAGTGSNANADQSVSRQVKAVTKQNLAGSKIIGRWKDGKTNTRLLGRRARFQVASRPRSRAPTA